MGEKLEETLHKKATIHQAATMLARLKMSYVQFICLEVASMVVTWCIVGFFPSWGAQGVHCDTCIEIHYCKHSKHII